MRLSNAARSLITVLTLALLGAAALAGCGGHPSAAPSQAAGPIVGDDCPDLAEGGSQVRFTDAHGSALAGVVFGKGGTGVVLSHMSDGDVCGWLPYARELANGGYRVLVYYFHGYGTSAGGADSSRLEGDVAAAAGYLRDHGARTIALVGASMGAAASLVAATTLQPAPAVVVSLSAPQTFRGLDALDAARRLTVPVLYAAGVGDLEFADAAQALYDATPATTNRTLLVASSASHGTHLVGAPGSQVRDAVDNALKQRAPANG
jgi:pimeloyl-ACP methyl ester carboxylesterase